MSPRGAKAFLGAASIVSIAVTCYLLLAFALFAATAVRTKFGDDQGVWFVRPTHLTMHLRAQTLAVTGLAAYPGPWSTYVDRSGAQVVSKGSVTRVVPRPTGLDIPVTASMLATMLDSNIVINSPEEGAVVRVTNARDNCLGIFSHNNLARFLEGPVEYRFGDRGEWRAYDGDFTCPDKGYDHLWLRPAPPMRQ